MFGLVFLTLLSKCWFVRSENWQKPPTLLAIFFVFSVLAAPTMAFEFSGVVYADETPLAGAKLELSGGPTQQNFSAVFTGGDGRFNFTGLEDGTYTLNILPPADRSDLPSSTNNPVTINGADKTQDFILLSGGGVVLSGDVRWSDGTLAENVWPLSVYLYREDEGGNYPSIHSPTYTANASPDIDSAENLSGGKFSVTVSPGTYRLGVDMSMPGGTDVDGVRHAGFNIGSYGGYFDDSGNFIYPSVEDLSVQVTVGETTPDTVSLSLPEYVTVSGKVVDENGVGIAGVSIRVEGWIRHSSLAVTPIVLGELNTQTDSEGNYIFAVPAHDDWDITLTPPEASGFTASSLTGFDFSVPSSKVFVMNLLDTMLPRFLSEPVIKTLTDEVAVVAWQTSEPTLTSVSGMGFSSVTSNQYRVTHETTLRGLSPSQAYSATVAITDRAGNGPVEASVSFTTLAAPDRTPPVIISGPIVSSATDEGAVVRWTTDEPALTALNWGPGDAINTLQFDNVYRTEHEIVLSGLSQLTNYVVQVSSTDAAGNGPTLSSIVTFKTLESSDNVAPVIVAGPFVSSLTDSEVTISWMTDEPAVSGVSLNDGSKYYVYRDESLSIEHEVRITGLSPATPYSYTVSSTDAAGNGPTLSVTDTFATQSDVDITPPAIVESLKVIGVSDTSATVHWTTDEPTYAIVLYGQSIASLGETATSIVLGAEHTVVLTGLAPYKTYYLTTLSIDTTGNTTSTNVSSFITLPEAELSGPVFIVPPTLRGFGDGSAALEWETDQASECFVEFGESDAEEIHRIDVGALGTEHQAILTGLLPGFSYQFSVTCRNASGFATTYETGSQTLVASRSNRLISGSFLVPTVAAGEVRARLSITDAAVVYRSADRFVVRVTTDKPTTIEARFGKSSGTEKQSIASPRYRTEHVLVLNNLQPLARYDISLRAWDLSGSGVTGGLAGESTASQSDATPPSLNGAPAIVVAGSDHIRLSFTGSEYATSEVTCTSSRSGYAWTVGSERLKTHHTYLVKGLEANTNYQCQITQIDVSGNKAVSDQYLVSLGSAAPEAAPSKPEISRTEVADGQITFYVSTAEFGDSDLETYTVSCSDGEGVVSVTSSTSPITLSGLDSSKSYSCSATVTNANGFTSDASDAINGLVPEALTSGLPVWLLYEASKQAR